MASLRVKTAAHRRSGNGRECGLLRQNSINRDDSSKSTSRPGHGAQAAAWNASLNFVKSHSPKTTANNGSSISTSPETDPGASDAFRFFEAGGADDNEGSDGEELEIDGSISSGSHPETVVQTRSRKEDSYRNPMFHMANAEVEKAVASLFPGEEEATNCSNPMFNRNVSEASMALARSSRQRSKRERAGRLTRSLSTDDSNGKISKDKEALSRAEQQFSRSIQSGGGFNMARCRVMPAEGIKREKAMYEHVGRMNYRPFIDGDEHDLEVKVNGCFRLDTFARNEGDSGGKAHFKFVFTLDYGTSLSGDSQDGSVASTSALSLISYSSTSTRIASGGEGKKRPVLDAIHDRDTGKMRVRVNDGREVNTTNGAVVEIALTDVGVVLFNPRTMAKGHHLYTLSLRGRTLFSVLA